MTLNRISTALLLFFNAYCLHWLIVGTWHCFPNAEDLSLSVEAIDYGFFGSIQGLLMQYDGRYFTNALHALNPLVHGWFMGYQVMPVIGMLSVVLSFWFLLLGFAPESNWRWRAPILSLSYLMVHLSVTPSLSHDLYWMVSSFVYMWPWTFFFLFIGSVLRFIRTPEGMLRNLWFLFCSASLVCGIGINEMFLVTYSVVLATMTYLAWRKGAKTLTLVIPLLIIGISSIVFFVSSPGIVKRMADQDVVRDWSHMAAVASVSSGHFLAFLKEVWFGNLTVLPWAMVSCIAMPDNLRLRFSRIPWLIVAVYAAFGLLCIWAMTWAFYWPMGADAVPPRRVQTSLLYGLQLWTWGLTARFVSAAWPFRPLLTINVIFNAVICLDIVTSKNNINDIKIEYLAGTLQEYRDQMLNRHLLLESVSQEGIWNVAVVQPISSLPTTVYDPPLLYPNRHQDYWNKAYERYYQLDEVRLSSDSITKLGILLSHGQE